MTLQGCVAFVTGGASGIGQAAAQQMAAQGAAVVVADVDLARAQQTVDVIRSSGGRAEAMLCDVSQEDEVETALSKTVEIFNRLDVMVNNAGISVRKSMLDMSAKEYEEVTKVNQFGVLYGMRGAAKRMIAAGTQGVIINTSSVYAYLASERRIAYHASKAAVDMMTRVAALELGKYGIRVVGVAPGFVDTPLVQSMNTDPQSWKRLSQDVHMRHQVIRPEQVASVVAFLAGDDASAINGTVVRVDDGFAAFK
ncbi:SDR family oxidoreductase [Alicyclobacillus cycloheptanicus]|uniref:NAD(P)-dependent dehydrogenase (Short-subunit alcohol dehydrogenase family) n=1 Tax=Alicyclobacillus cycloheptanicus TaxID=1457 RepID=A0ABT9XI30_9BACL|nr:SDR family oxidoreductase [Alicyclobacillus cycloheptanicus]MDQ0189361.1 NAD(P)-dependent dehydrogenase (short-subunit alcohol dehydrogenase family) [Alicyclobacillus cycloheptanicus]WDM01286.1 SDR family oxidoreductase [Alicyclobacillus cycloheptanicus]